METICHFEFTIVNLATYRLLTIVLLKKYIRISLSLGYPNSYFCNKYVICCSNGYIYNFFG